MALKKVFQRYTFSDANLNTVLQDYRDGINGLTEYFLGTDLGNLRLYDTSKRNLLEIKWNESASNPYILNFKVNSGNRTVNLSANLTVEAASTINQDLTTDADAVLNDLTLSNPSNIYNGLVHDSFASGHQDVKIAASPAFTAASLGAGELTAGSINRGSGTLTLGIGGTTVGSIASTGVTIAGNILASKAGQGNEITVGADSDQTAKVIWQLGGVSQWEIYRPGNSYDLRIDEYGVGDQFTFARGGNFGIGATTFGTSAARVLGMISTSAVAPTDSPENMVQLWAEDRSAAHSTLYYRAESGEARPLGNMLNVKDYGAVGDDSNDDSAAIQAAMDELANDLGGIVFFPPGTYKTIARLNVPSNITLYGKEAIIKNISWGENVRIIQNNNTGGGNENIIIDGLEVRGEVSTSGAIGKVNATPTAGGSGYSVSDVLTVTTYSGDATVTVDSIGGGGSVGAISLTDGGAEAATYEVSVGNATSYAGAGTGCTIEITAFAVRTNCQNSIRMENVDHLKIKNCKTYYSEKGIETTPETMDDIEITNNYIEGNTIYAIFARGNGIRVTSNFVKNHGYDDGTNLNSKEAIVVALGGDAEGENNLVAFNEVDTCEHSGIAIVKMIDVVVMGNMIQSAMWGMEINNVRGATIVGNTVSQCSEYGIYLNGSNPGHGSGDPEVYKTSERIMVALNTVDGGEVGIGGGDYKSITIANNMIYNQEERGISYGAGDVYASDVYAHTASCIITGNQISDNDGTTGYKGIVVAGIGNLTIRDNVLSRLVSDEEGILVTNVTNSQWENIPQGVTIEGNKIHGCTHNYGIKALRVHDLTIQDNQLNNDNTFNSSMYDIDQISGTLVYDEKYASVPTSRRIGYSLGDVLYYDQNDPNGVYGWMCSTPGDFYTTIGITGTIAGASDQLTISSADGFYVGAHINVVGAGAGGDLDTYITAISGTTFTLEDAATDGGTDADVDYVNPVHKQLRYSPSDIIIPNAGVIGSASDLDAISIDSTGKTTFTQDLTVNEDIIIGNSKYIGSVGDPDAIQIPSTGKVTLTQDLVCNEDIVIGDAKYIGSVSAPGAMSIASTGVVTFQQDTHLSVDLHFVNNAALKFRNNADNDDLVCVNMDTSNILNVGADGSIASIKIGQTFNLGTCIDAGADVDKFLVLDATGNVDYRTGAEVASDIGASGDVTAAANIDANAVVIGDDGAKGVKKSTLLVSDAGEMTNPSQPAFFAYNSVADLNVTGDGTVFNIDFDTEVDDVGGNFAADRFTAPVDGQYHFSFNVLMVALNPAVHTSVDCYLVTSNSGAIWINVHEAGVTSGGYQEAHASVTIWLDANDTAYIYLQVTGTNKNVGVYGGGSYHTFFSGHLVC